jgi:ABC-type branched-subunit amino acid transport system substrate-binding protein
MWWQLPLVIAVMMVGAACGDNGKGSAPESDDPTGAPADEVKSDFGVTDTEIRLGQHVVMSGDLKKDYETLVPALQAYFKYVNEQGGICDRSTRLIVEDDQYSPAIALAKATKLVEEDEVAAFVGNLGTPPNTGSAAYINEQEVPDLFIGTGDNTFSNVEALPWTALFSPDYASEGAILADYVNENFAGKTVAILSQNDDFGKSGRDGFVESFDGELAAEETYELAATEIDVQLASLKSATPDVVYAYATPAFTARLYDYMKANDWKPQVVMSYVNSAATLAALVGGDAGPAEGFKQIAGAITNTYVLDAVGEAKAPAVQDHAKIMADNGGPPVGTLTIYAQALAETVVQTLEIACENGDLTRNGILEAAESVEGFHPSVLLEGIDVTLGPGDHSAIQSLQPVQVQQDGTLTQLTEAPVGAEGVSE